MIAANPSAIFTGSPAISLAGKSIIQGKGVAIASRFTAGGKVSMGATIPERNIYGIISKRSIAAAFSLQKQKVVNTSCSKNLSKNAAIIAINPKNSAPADGSQIKPGAAIPSSASSTATMGMRDACSLKWAVR